MKFCLIDKITDIQVGERITAVKCLSLAEEYLQDHFPRFPVMPGVLMLEAMTQTGAWLVRATDNFEYGVTILKEARNVKYADFVEPGEFLQINAQITQRDGGLTTLKVSGEVGGETAVSSKIILESYQSSGTDHPSSTDQNAIRVQKRWFNLLCRTNQPI